MFRDGIYCAVVILARTLANMKMQVQNQKVRFLLANGCTYASGMPLQTKQVVTYSGTFTLPVTGHGAPPACK